MGLVFLMNYVLQILVVSIFWMSPGCWLMCIEHILCFHKLAQACSRALGRSKFESKPEFTRVLQVSTYMLAVANKLLVKISHSETQRQNRRIQQDWAKYMVPELFAEYFKQVRFPLKPRLEILLLRISLLDTSAEVKLVFFSTTVIDWFSTLVTSFY